jgi:chromosome segregation ATPase
MKSRFAFVVLAVALAVLFGSAILRAADDPSGGDARLRQSLRETMVQLRQAQSDLAALQATQSAQADDTKAARDQLALMAKHKAEDQAEAAKAADTAKAKLAKQAAEIAHLQESLGQWRAAAEKLNQSGAAVEAQRVKAMNVAAALERQVEDLKGRNAELYRLGSAILDRYEKFGLGEQFLSREPFIGRTRVDLENQIQDFSDQLTAQKVTP